MEQRIYFFDKDKISLRATEKPGGLTVHGVAKLDMTEHVLTVYKIL